MSKQPSLPFDENAFNLEIGLKLKEEGMSLACENRKEVLETARAFARKIAFNKGTVTADDVQAALMQHGINLGNAAGSIFSPSEFEFTGAWKTSNRISNHGRQNRVWRLRND